jgi:hypothetical protein
MKNILTVFTAFVLFVLFSFTFSSCKGCDKNKHPDGDDSPPSQVRPQDQSPAIPSPNDGSGGNVVDNGSDDGPDGNAVDNGSDEEVVDNGSYGKGVDLGGVVDINKIEEIKRVVREAKTQAVKAADDAQEVKDEITQRLGDVLLSGDYDDECEEMDAVQEELDKMVEFAKTAKTQAANATKEVVAMNAALATDLEPSVRVALEEVAREVEEASREANNAAVSVRQAVVDAAEAMIEKWRVIVANGDNSSYEVAKTTTEIIKVAAIKVEWLVLDERKRDARDVLAMMRIEIEKVKSFAHEAHARGSWQLGDEPMESDIWNDAARAALERAQEAYK